MLVNSTTASSKQGNIRKLMLTPSKGKPHPSTTKAVNKSEIVIDEKKHRETNKLVTCSLSQSAHLSLHSLVDRGANAEIAGNDVRVICKGPSKTVNARGSDNHEITSIPLVTAGRSRLQLLGR